MKNNKKDDENNIYVFEKSIEVQKKNIEIIQKGIENQRTKAGLLLGFFFLITIQCLDEFSRLLPIFQGIIITLLVFAFYFILQSFQSKKVETIISVEDNFKKKWNEKEIFLKNHHEAMNKIEKSLSGLLTEISSQISLSVLIFGAIVLFFLFNTLLCQKEIQMIIL